MVAAAAATASNTQNPTRPPLIPSEKDNAAPPRKPKSKLIPSRYMSSSTSSSSIPSSNSTSRRCSSPLVVRTAPEPPSVGRSLSADRRRPESRVSGNAGPGDVSAAARVLKTSVRSLSVSFQGESFALPVSKTKAAPPTPSVSAFPSSRKPTPERRRGASNQVENSRPSSDRRWPSTVRVVSRDLGVLTRSLDFTAAADSKRCSLNGGARASFDGRLWPSLGSDNSCDLSASDSESVSSGSNSGTHDSCRGPSTPRGSNGVPMKVWPETSAHLRRLQDPGSLLSPKLGILPKRNSLDGPPTLSPRTVSMGRSLSSPLRGPPARHPSPMKLPESVAATPSRGMASPSRTRGLVFASPSVNVGVGYHQPSISTPSILSFGTDCRTRRMGKSQIEELHLSKIYYNGHLQWRFANARAEKAMVDQMRTAEKTLYSTWLSILQLRDSVTKQKIRLHLLTHNLKLSSILKGQMTYLEEWVNMDRDHSNSLSGAADALKASTLRLPVVDGATADIQKLEDAVASAVDVMRAIASSTLFLLSKVEKLNTLVAQLAGMTAQERALLDQCGDLLSTIAAMQVTHCSLRTNLLQLKHKPRLTYL
ncbi:hypothetical protein QJS10_CPA02g00305 [Acorus calamus]|uniref:QWRF motif-containing protein 2 n=1 Tax=Acorus calamus TaxID=4465 RepID=A0AAV9FED2_ACOCL|nr:hypothetical protein QJS10_CPA02g00305 [Acorus calamus]